ncbi:dnaJ homolog subfamily C member 30, mitochondrial [Rhinophrynus dorsalis]
MAEVSRRLLRYSVQQLSTDALEVTGGSNHTLCLSPVPTQTNKSKKLHVKVTPYATESTTSASRRLWSGTFSKADITWSTDCLRGRSRFLLVSGEGIRSRQRLRFFSRGTNLGASYKNSGTRRSSNNNAQDVLPLYRSRTAYYDILGVTGNATQSQIKTAYYKQSFLYHPDRNHGSEEAAGRFGEVSEAYHILGSVSLRKKYDRGILSLEDVRTAGKPSGKAASPSRKGTSPHREGSSSSSSKTPIKPVFDFDAFYQAHYGEQLERERFWKEKREQMQKIKTKQDRLPFYKLSEISVALLLLSAAFLLISFK